MGRLVDLTGYLIKQLRVESFAGMNKYGRSTWNCVCKCGNRVVYAGNQLQRGAVSTCGRCPNRIETLENLVVIWLPYSGSEKPCFIDAADYHLVKEHRWHAKKGRDKTVFYARSTEGAYMHALLVGKNADHKDGDGLNNRRENLRSATASENARNKGARIDNVTGFKGVYINHGRFYATITVNRVIHRLGRFNTAIEAARAYNEAAKKYHGEFAYLNDVGDYDLILNQKPEGE